jgi:predicted nucleic acid-binding Zn ribbon protein
VFTRWEEVVGATLAGHATPVRVEAGVLVVAVDQPPWATQVRVLGPRILARVAELAGDRADRLDRVEVVVRRRGDR